MTFRLIISVAAALGLAGCPSNPDFGESDSTADTGDSGDTATDGEPAEVAFEEFYDKAEVAYCGWQTECRQFGVEARCRAVNHMEVRLSMQRLAGVGSNDAVPIDYMKEAVKVGRIDFDADAATICLAYVRARSCDLEYFHAWTEEELAGQAACEGVFKGRMGRNGPCVSAAECAEESICGFDPTCVDMCCVGACRVLAEPIAVGGSCAGSTPCVADAYCAFDPNTGLPTVCTAAPKLGQGCSNGSCVTGAYCDYNGDQPICGALKAEGGRCNGDYECAQPGVCRYDVDDFDGGTCFRPRDEGEACDPSDGGYQQCRRFDNQCHAVDKVCAPLPDNGEPCPNYACRGDLFCTESQAQRCVPLADEGEFCGYSDDYSSYTPCSGDHFCDGESDQGLCAAPSGAAGCSVPPDPSAG